MTTRQLAEKLDIVPTTIIMYENGKHPIPYDIAIKLSDVLKIEVSLLIPYTEALKIVRMAQNLICSRTYGEKSSSEQGNPAACLGVAHE